jgi:two-component system phosphate regulon sensor histidine kinase PhoR
MIIIVGSIGTGLVLIFVVLYALIRKIRESEDLKYEFITIIAHKFRTPLTQIKWLTEGLMDKVAEPYAKQSLQEIESANDNLIKLTSTLIELTDAVNNAKSSYHFETINACELVHGIVDQMKSMFHEKNIFLSVTCSVPVVLVRADRARMEFVMNTLLENACTYTPPGRDVSVNISTDNKHVTISVTDNGIGIESKNMTRLFTKFYRSKEARAAYTEGMGVGLYLALSIVKRHHGKVDVVSDGLNKGSTFSVILPLSKK